MNHRWLIAAAVEEEIQGIRSAVECRREGSDLQGNAWTGAWKGNPLLLVRTGVGPGKAGAALRPFLTDHRPCGVISTGYAGALRDGYNLGDILLPAEVQSIPPLPEIRLRPDPELRERLLRAVRLNRWQVHTSRMITTDRVIFSSDEKRRLGLEYDAGSVEMESAIIAELATSQSVPFIVVRVVLDEAAFSLPDVLEALRWKRRGQFGKLISYMALHPYKLVQLLKLQQRSRMASQCLRRLFLTCLLDGLLADDVRS